MPRILFGIPINRETMFLGAGQTCNLIKTNRSCLWLCLFASQIASDFFLKKSNSTHLSIFWCDQEFQGLTCMWRQPGHSFIHFLLIRYWLFFMRKLSFSPAAASSPECNYYLPLPHVWSWRISYYNWSWHMSKMKIVPKHVWNSYKLGLTELYYLCDFSES